VAPGWDVGARWEAWSPGVWQPPVPECCLLACNWKELEGKGAAGLLCCVVTDSSSSSHTMMMGSCSCRLSPTFGSSRRAV